MMLLDSTGRTCLQMSSQHILLVSALHVTLTAYTISCSINSNIICFLGYTAMVLSGLALHKFALPST